MREAHTAKPRQSDTGIFASLSTLLRFEGSGAPSTRRAHFTPAALLLAALAAILALSAAPASASTRTHQSSFGSFSGIDPGALTVDQKTGDLYTLDPSADSLSRFTASGAPDDFTAGPGATTNTIPGLTGLQNYPSLDQVAIDRSGGPSDGNIYVTQSGSGTVKVFASSGEPLATLSGSGTPAGGFGEVCGAAVDQSNGDLYLASFENRIWRYSPSSATVAEADYSGAVATSFNPCQLAVGAGSLYAHNWLENPKVGFGPLRKTSTSAFIDGTPPPPPSSPAFTTLDPSATAVATDPTNGDVYVDEGDKVSVFDSTGNSLYSFGSAAANGSASAGVAVMSSGAAAYLADPTSHQVDVYGATLKPSTRTHQSSFGSFSGIDPGALTVDQKTGDLYTLDPSADSLSRFTASGAPDDFTAGPGATTNTIPGLTGLQNYPSLDQVAIDRSGGPSDGNIYVTQSGSGTVKVFASSGEPLATLSGSGTPAGGFGEVCGAAVDQSNGDLYLASFENRIWRYSPSGATVAEADYSGAVATSFNPCQLAVGAGSLYAHNWLENPKVGFGPLRKTSTSAFIDGTPPPPPSSPAFTTLDPSATAVATDPTNGDVYVDEGDKVSVFDSTGNSLYSFGSAAANGSASAGVAVMSSGAAAYLADPTSHQVDVYGATLKPSTRTHQSSFGSFSGIDPGALTVDQKTGDLYTLDPSADSLSRFTASGAPDDFTAGPGATTNTIPGLTGLQNYPSLDQVAIDRSGGPSDGNIYVTQSGSGTVKVFASSGEPLATLSGSGTPAGGFGEVCGAAVDQSNGDLYLASFENRIWRYSPSGATVAEADYSGAVATSFNPCQLAVGAGSLYAHNWLENPKVGFGPLRKTSTSAFIDGTPPPPPSSPAFTTLDPSATAVATDPTNGDVYVDEGDKVSVFDSTGNSLYSFGSAAANGSASAGVAVMSSGAAAYLADPSSHQVDVYGAFSLPGISPLLTTAPATDIHHTHAAVSGHLDPNGGPAITDCHFDYVTDASFQATGFAGASTAPCTEGNSFSAPADVSSTLAGLTPGTTYHLRLHLGTSEGSFAATDPKTFTTPAATATPEVTTGSGAILSATSSTINGTVDPAGNPLTDCHFEYVTDVAFSATGFTDLSSGGSQPCTPAFGSIPADFEDHPVSATLTGLDPANVYYFRLLAANANGTAAGTQVTVPGPPLVETTGSPTRTATTARFDSRVNSHGAATTYHFQYVTDADFQATGFANAQSTPDTPLITDEVQTTFITSNATGNFKLGFAGDTTSDLPAKATSAQIQAALRALPSIGSPNVTVTRDLEFVYITFTGSLADTDVPQLTVSNGTPPFSVILPTIETAIPGGPGDTLSLLSAAVHNLDPATTYHYRVLADNGTPGGPAFGADMTLTTRASDAPLSHGHFPGPPGSDRAWEQVSTPDTSGNPVARAFAFSADGDRALYNVSGGTPDSETGSLSNALFAERTPTGWQTRSIYPTRTEAPETSWTPPAATSDLSQIFSINHSLGSGTYTANWAISPDSPPRRLSQFLDSQALGGVFTAVAADGSRVVTLLRGSFDPDHPVIASGAGEIQLYDITDATPRLISLLPDGSVPACGVGASQAANTPDQFGQRRFQNWVSPDGSYAFFPSAGSGPCAFQPSQLYARDLNADTTTLVSGPVLSGPDCDAQFIKSTPGAVFFWTQSRLTADDTVHIGECGFGNTTDGDVYRYDLAGGPAALKCVTCVVPGLDADVITEFDSQAYGAIAVAGDGSRLYFASRKRLTPGATADPNAIYRVDVATGDLDYVAPLGFHLAPEERGGAINTDGSVYVFGSDDPGLNALNGPQNGGTNQYYRYDDNDRSLLCVSCPPDGSPPRAAVPEVLGSVGDEKLGPNLGPLSSDGGVIGFSTPTPLVSADQNTAAPGHEPVAGTDAYEWRDGALHLISDGLTSSAGTAGDPIIPTVQGVSPSGNDVFFTQAAQLTPDAIDAFQRLYDARIGGGFDFPTPPPPCPLEVCQGTPKGAPEEQPPGTSSFRGPGNEETPKCPKGKLRKRGKCVKKHPKAKTHRKRHHRAADHNRRASR